MNLQDQYDMEQEQICQKESHNCDGDYSATNSETSVSNIDSAYEKIEGL